MKLAVEITETELKYLILEHMKEKFGDAKFDPKLIRIEVKSKQNYRSEWEEAAYRARYEGDV